MGSLPDYAYTLIVLTPSRYIQHQCTNYFILVLTQLICYKNIKMENSFLISLADKRLPNYVSHGRYAQ